MRLPNHHRRNRNVRASNLLLHRVTSMWQLLGRRRPLRRITIIGERDSTAEVERRLSEWYLKSVRDQDLVVIDTQPRVKLRNLRRSRSLFLLTATAPIDAATFAAAIVNKLRIADDERFSSAAPTQLARLAQFDMQPRRQLRDGSNHEQLRVTMLSARIERRAVAQVFGTGPSLDRVAESQVRHDALRITCNSAVANSAVMEVVKPHGIVFGDPVFHFGPSSYAHIFREELNSWLSLDHSRWAVIPREFHSLLGDLDAKNQIFSVRVTALWPLIGLPRSATGRFPRTGNILTHLLLPLAASYSDRIEVFGCDGRDPGDGGFWQLASSRLSTSYTSVQESHPGFFHGVSYVDYYELHCRRLENIVSRLERAGKAVCSASPSFIPALARRTCEPE